mmetsp:Transcript_36549/g.70141  ORF Transcript_36549/g.70141 Transcript_36549/m.70141 type:complete len:232 (+) Transcript_36549:1929-2624(+)
MPKRNYGVAANEVAQLSCAGELDSVCKVGAQTREVVKEMDTLPHQDVGHVQRVEPLVHQVKSHALVGGGRRRALLLLLLWLLVFAVHLGQAQQPLAQHHPLLLAVGRHVVQDLGAVVKRHGGFLAALLALLPFLPFRLSRLPFSILALPGLLRVALVSHLGFGHGGVLQAGNVARAHTRLLHYGGHRLVEEDIGVGGELFQVLDASLPLRQHRLLRARRLLRGCPLLSSPS